MFFALLHTSVTWEMDNSVRPRKWEVLVMSALVSQGWCSSPRAWQVEHLGWSQTLYRSWWQNKGRQVREGAGEETIRGKEFEGWLSVCWSETLKSGLWEVFRFWTWMESLACCEFGGWPCVLGRSWECTEKRMIKHLWFCESAHEERCCNRIWGALGVLELWLTTN